MESTANINNTNTTGIFSEISIKIRYKSNGITITENLGLYSDTNLDNAFNEFNAKKSITEIKNGQNERVFYLIRDNQKIQLDKNKRILDLDIKEGDLIEVSYKVPENINEDLRHNIQNSDANLNEPIPKKKTNYFVIFGISGLVIACLVVALLCVFLIKKDKNKSNNQSAKEDNNDGQERGGNEENPQTDKEKEKDNDDINLSNKQYYSESLITNKKPYDQLNKLFLYQSEKIINLELELNSESERNTSEANFTTIQKFTNFGLIITEKHQEKDEANSLIKNYYTGYLSLLNLTINNGTDDLELIRNDELYNSIEQTKSTQTENTEIIDGPEQIVTSEIIDSSEKIKNFRLLDEGETDTYSISEQNELAFIRINFYENGELRDLYVPNNFNDSYMSFFDEIIKLIFPKLSKDLYSNNFTEDFNNLTKTLNQIDNEEEEISSDSLDIYDMDDTRETSENFFDENSENEEQDNNDNNLLIRRISVKETILENIQSTNLLENEEIVDPDKEYSEDSKNNKYPHLKGIEENDTFSNITQFDVDDVESTEAKLEGSQIKKLRNYFLDEKGMIFSIMELENITIYQPDNETLSDSTDEENKLKEGIYNENNEILRNETEQDQFGGKDFNFNVSSIFLQNSHNVSLIDTIEDKGFVTNLLNILNKFSFLKYNSKENSDLNLRFLKYKNELKSAFDQNNDIQDSEMEIEHLKLSKKDSKRNLQYDNSYYGLKNFEKEKILFKYNLIGLVLEGITVSKIEVSTGIIENYFKLTLGFINFKMKFATIQTNLHIIIKNSHPNRMRT